MSIIDFKKSQSSLHILKISPVKFSSLRKFSNLITAHRALEATVQCVCDVGEVDNVCVFPLILILTSKRHAEINILNIMIFLKKDPSVCQKLKDTIILPHFKTFCDLSQDQLFVRSFAAFSPRYKFKTVAMEH